MESLYGPMARILLRYGVGILAGVVLGANVGANIGETLAGNPDVVMIAAAAIGALVEGAYILAKRRGWST